VRILDLCCCAGGATAGYWDAGFDDVVGVDIAPQPNYPSEFEFIQADALEVLRDVQYVRTFDAVHASFPCQRFTALQAVNRNQDAWPDLIAPGRTLLDASGVPYVMENVQGAPLRRDLTLCGEMFGLGVIRHRYFELGGWTATQPIHKPHRGRVAGYRHGEWFDGPYFAVYGDGGGKGTVAQWQHAMRIDWTTDKHELAEAIPPAYTQYVGEQLLLDLKERAAA
jgi:hypothetical protein